MDFEFENDKNEKNEITVAEQENTSEEINKITDNFFKENYTSSSVNENFNTNNTNFDNSNLSNLDNSDFNNFNSFNPTNAFNGSINLTLDGTTVKNMKFISTAMKIFSVLGIISGVFQLIVFLIGIFTIIISIKFFKAATFLEEAIYTKDENKLKLYFSEQVKGFKLYIIFIIVSIALTAIFYAIFIIMALLGAAASSV